MSSVHYGDGGEVRNLGRKLVQNVKEIKEISEQGDKLLKMMQGSVNDNAYQEAEEIVREVARLLYNGLSDVAEVADKLRKYGEFLDEMSR